MCNERDIRVNKENGNWVDLTELPRNGKTNRINWENIKNTYVDINYENKIYSIYIEEYDKNIKKLKCVYKNRVEYMYAGHFTECKFGKILNKYTCEFKLETGNRIINKNNDITIINKKYYTDSSRIERKAYQYKCNKCGFECGEHYKNGEYIKEYWDDETHVMNKKMYCGCCGGHSKIVVEGINDIPTTAPWMVKYFQGGYDEAKMYTCNSSVKIYFKCTDCGKVRKKAVPIYMLYASRFLNCDFCKDGTSYPEKVMYSILKQLDLDFETQYSPEWSEQKRYDFYIPSLNCIIETHGEQHYKKNGMGMYKNKAKYIKENDIFKNKLALNNGIKFYIQLDCSNSNIEFIRSNILKSKLNNMFDLTKINWGECEEFAISNICKNICGYKNNNPDASITDMHNIFKLNKNTIREYLKKGTKLGWCMYDAKEELKRIGGKPVKVFKSNEFIITLPSCAEVSRYIKDIYNIEIDSRRVSDVCNRRNQKFKGFVFEYLNYDYSKKDNPIEDNKKKEHKNGKQVEIFKDNKSLGIFSSCSELERQSEELFGVKLNHGLISAVALGKKKLYKGFSFKYLNYDLKERENKINNQLNIHGKPIKIFKDGICIGIFPSMAELTRQSKKLFGVTLDVTHMSKVAQGKAKTHKGFTFKFTNEDDNNPTIDNQNIKVS